MTDNELTVLDVLTDNTKNFCNIYENNDNDDDPLISLTDSLYYTETEFTQFINSKHLNNNDNLTIISINIANLLSKLTFFKTFLNNIKTQENEADIIVVVETHISKPETLGFTTEELKNILPEYNFYHKGRSSKNGGWVGIFVRKALSGDIFVSDEVEGM